MASMADVLKVAVAHRPPFVFAQEGIASSNYYGLMVDLLDKVLQRMTHNVTYEMYLAPENSGGVKLPNGTWTGIMRELTAGGADVALFPLTRTLPRVDDVDMTYSYFGGPLEGYSILVSASDEQPGLASVLAPFTTALWVLLLFTIVGVTLVFWALDVYGRWIRRHSVRRMRHRSGLPVAGAAKHRRKERANHVMVSLTAAAGAPEKPNRNGWGVQVLYIAYCFFCLIVLSAYTANLTSFLTVAHLDASIDSLEDVVVSGASVAVVAGGSSHDYFLTSKDPLVAQLRGRLVHCSYAECVQLVRSGDVGAFCSDKPLLAYEASQRPCNLAVVGEPFGPGSLVVGARKGFRYLAEFDEALQAFAEDGTLERLRDRWFAQLSQCSEEDFLANSRLTMWQMAGAFIFLAVGVAIAFVIGTVENLKWCLAVAEVDPEGESQVTYSLRNLPGFSALPLFRKRGSSSSRQPHGAGSVAASVASAGRLGSNATATDSGEQQGPAGHFGGKGPMGHSGSSAGALGHLGSGSSSQSGTATPRGVELARPRESAGLIPAGCNGGGAEDGAEACGPAAAGGSGRGQRGQ